MKPTIDNTGLKYENRSTFYYTFSDFHVGGEPIDEDCEFIKPADDVVYVDKQSTSISSHDIYAKFVTLYSDKIEYISLHEIMMSGSPVDLDTDEEMDLLDDDVYQIVDGEFVKIDDL